MEKIEKINYKSYNNDNAAPPGIQNNINENNNINEEENKGPADDLNISSFNNYIDLQEKYKPSEKIIIGPNYNSNYYIESSSIKFMNQIYINDLKLSFIHYNCFIVLIIKTKILIMVSKQFLAEDEKSNKTNVSIYNFDKNFKIEDFKIGRYIIIKEPFYKMFLDLTKGIRVDNPDNVLLFKNKKEVYEYINKECASNLEYEKLGDNHFNLKEYIYALNCYNYSLNSKINDKNNINNYKNRIYKKISICALEINAFNLALDNIEESLKYNSNDKELIIIKIKALIGIRNFEKANEILNNNKNLFTNNEIKKYKYLIETNINNSKGEFNFSEMFYEEKNGNKINISDYINNKLELSFDNKHGNKIIAKDNILKGELLMVTKSIYFYKYPKEEIEKNIMTELISNDLKSLYKLSKKDFQKLFDLYSLLEKGKKIEERKKNFTDKYYYIQNILDYHSNVNMIEAYNSFYLSEFKGYGCGLWYYPSFLNNNCDSNTFYFCIGDIFILFSQKGIKKNEEIFLNYEVYGMNFFQRKEYFNFCLIFNCDCEICEIQNKLYNDKNLYEGFYKIITDCTLNRHNYYAIEIYNYLKKAEKFLIDNIFEFHYFELIIYYYRFGYYFNEEYFFNEIEDSLLKAYMIAKGNNFNFECVILYDLYKLYVKFGMSEKKKKLEDLIKNELKSLKILPNQFIGVFLKEKVFLDIKEPKQIKKIPFSKKFLPYISLKRYISNLNFNYLMENKLIFLSVLIFVIISYFGSKNSIKHNNEK